MRVQTGVWIIIDSFDLFKLQFLWCNRPKNFLFLCFVKALKRNLSSHRLRMTERIAPRQKSKFGSKWIYAACNSHFDLKIWFYEIKFWQYLFFEKLRHTPLLSFCCPWVAFVITSLKSRQQMRVQVCIWTTVDSNDLFKQLVLGWNCEIDPKIFFYILHWSFEKKPLFSSLENGRNCST